MKERGDEKMKRMVSELKEWEKKTQERKDERNESTHTFRGPTNQREPNASARGEASSAAHAIQ